MEDVIMLNPEKRNGSSALNGTHQNFIRKAYAEIILANEYHSNKLVVVASKGLKKPSESSSGELEG